MKILLYGFQLIVLLAVINISVMGISQVYAGETFDKKEIKTEKDKLTEGKKVTQKKAEEAVIKKEEKPKVTFVELGAARCIPCKMMQSVMKAIEEEYKGVVKVVFYDVWTEAGRPFAESYNINLIPTQVFLDENEKEFFRHEGYFPKEEIVKLLESKGVRGNTKAVPVSLPDKKNKKVPLKKNR